MKFSELPIRQKKLAMIFTIIVLYIPTLLVIFLNDAHSGVREQLKRLQSAELNNCRINKVDFFTYPESRGTYKVFFTDCVKGTLPALFEKRYDSLIKVGTEISKSSDSQIIQITNNRSSTELKIKDPSTEDHRLRKMIIPSVLGCAFILLILLSKNPRMSLFQFEN